MDKQLQEIYDNAEKAGACEDGLSWLSQFETFEEVEQDEHAPDYFYWYALYAIRGRWELGEKAIADDDASSYYYARDVLKSRFELGEEVISKDVMYSYNYAHDAIKGRFELGEKVISKDTYYSFIYAKYVLKTRFELGEKAILNSPYKKLYKKFLDEISTFDQNRV